MNNEVKWLTINYFLLKKGVTYSIYDCPSDDRKDRTRNSVIKLY